jgi:protein phosphatase 2C
VGEEEVVVANCGDCRAVMCRGGGALALSKDHKVRV